MPFLRKFKNEGAEQDIWTSTDKGTGGWRKLYSEELHN